MGKERKILLQNTPKKGCQVRDVAGGTSMTSRFMVYGAGGHAKVVLDGLEQIKGEIIGVVDDDPNKHNTTILGYKVIGDSKKIKDKMSVLRQCQWIIAIGDNLQRAYVATQVLGSNVSFGKLLHPAATISPHTEIEPGVQIMAGAVVNCATHVGLHTIINTGATVDHDSYIEAYCHIAPGVHMGGGIFVGQGTLVGIGASILPNIRIGRWSIIGAGSVVTKDVPDGVVVAGVPARLIRRLSSVELSSFNRKLR